MKIGEEIQKRYLKLLLYDQTNKQTKKKTQKASQLRSKKLIILARKKTLNGLNPKFIANIFNHSPNSARKKYNPYVQDHCKSKLL